MAAQLLVLSFKVVMQLELAYGVSQMYKEENVTSANPARQICRPVILLDVVDVSSTNFILKILMFDGWYMKFHRFQS